MADQPVSSPTPIGIYDRPQQPGITGIEIAGGMVSLVWIAIVFGVLLFGGEQGTDEIGLVLKLLVLALPLGMVWLIVITIRANRSIRSESARLQAAVEGLRKAYVAQAQEERKNPPQTIAKKLDDIAAAQLKTESALATFTSSRATQAATAQVIAATTSGDIDLDQASLELGTPAEALEPPLPNDEFVRALNFPETADDEEGFSALRRALKHRQTAQLIQAAQDVLTLLSQDGIYMDDLRPDVARSEIWRKFAKGERGRAIAALGGVRDRSSLALTAGRMKQDPIFRDAAHHFLRVFDKTFAAFEAEATDTDLNNLGNTRTARAFMLLGRIAGTFD